MVLVQEFFSEASSYQIDLTGGNNNSVQLAGNIANGETVTGVVPVGQEIVWVFAAQTGDVVDVLLRPLDSFGDVVLVLRDPDNNVIMSIDAALAGEAESLNDFEITIDGEWTLLLQEFFDEEVNYELTLTLAVAEE